MTDLYEPLATLPREQRKLLKEIGSSWSRDIHANRDLVLSIYTPIVAKASKDGVFVVRDAAYGPHARQILDLFVPQDAKNCDLAVFVHGGAFLRGNKSVNGEIYDNFCYWMARQGIAVANLEYRLSSEAPYPAGGHDVRCAVQWCVENVAQYGANATRIFLVGHSAGGTHVGTYLTDPVMGQAPATNVIGAVLISGRLRADAQPDNPNAAGVRSYFGDNESRYEERSPISHAHRTSLPFLVAVAEFENPYLDVYGFEFASRCAVARGRAVDFVRLLGHNHTSMMAHFNSGEELLGRRILHFMGAC